MTPQTSNLLTAAWSSIDEAHAAKWAWFAGPRITQEDLLQGSAKVERVSAQEVARWFRGGDSGGGRNVQAWNGARSGATPTGPTLRSSGATAQRPKARPPLLMGFGKYKDKLMVEVREDDPRYWAWATTEMQWFRKRAEAAGLLDDDEDKQRAAQPPTKAQRDWERMESAAEYMNPDDPYENGSWIGKH